MRYVRELLELIVGVAIGLGIAWVVHEYRPQLSPRGIDHETWFCVAGGIGLLLALAWSGWQVGKTVDRRLPRHLRQVPRFRDGRPFGVLAWRARDLASEYLWVLLGVLVVLVIIWLAKTFVPGW